MTEKNSLLCNGKHHEMERFIETCLLLLLYKETGYGYALMEQLNYFDFSEGRLNISTLYRRLRKMEKEELVVSAWEESSKGPKKRIYSITDKGKEKLAKWIQILKSRKSKIVKLIDKYDETVKTSH